MACELHADEREAALAALAAVVRFRPSCHARNSAGTPPHAYAQVSMIIRYR
jgi:hypothetical protein